MQSSKSGPHENGKSSWRPRRLWKDMATLLLGWLAWPLKRLAKRLGP